MRSLVGSEILFSSWQDWQRASGQSPTSPSELGLLLTNGQLLLGSEAWRCLLRLLPALKPLATLAETLGLGSSMGKLAQRAGYLLRGLCRGCPRSAPWQRPAR